MDDMTFVGVSICIGFVFMVLWKTCQLEKQTSDIVQLENSGQSDQGSFCLVISSREGLIKVRE